MDKFLKFHKDNRLTNFVGHLDILNTLVTIIEDNGIICLYGGVGVGKSHLCKVALKNRRWVGVSRMSDVGDQLRESHAHVLVDSHTLDKSILEYGKKLSRGATIIIVHSIEKINFCDCLQCPPLSINQMVEIGARESPTTDRSHLTTLAFEARGDCRTFLNTIRFPGMRDYFQDSKQWLYSMMCQGGGGDPMREIGRKHSDHGYVADLVHSNIHMGFKEINPLPFQLIAEGDTYDNDPTWELIDYFWVASVYHPIKLMDKKIPDVSMKNGTAWTKFSNHKMREKRLRGLPDRDTLMLLHKLQDPKLLAAYGVTPQQYDTINNISFNKIAKTKPIKEDLKALVHRPYAWRTVAFAESP